MHCLGFSARHVPLFCRFTLWGTCVRLADKSDEKFPPDLSSRAGKTCHWCWARKHSGLRAFRGSPLCPWGVKGGCHCIHRRVCPHLAPQPFAVGEGLCCSPSSVLPAAGTIVPFCVCNHKALTMRSVPWCLRGKNLTCSHSVTPYGQFVFYKSRFFLTFGEMAGCLGVVLQ